MTDKYCACSIQVAVFYDPQNKAFFASTVPHGPRAKVMAQNTGNARRWLAAVAPNPQTPKFHAEDGAYYNWESSVLGALAPGTKCEWSEDSPTKPSRKGS